MTDGEMNMKVEEMNKKNRCAFALIQEYAIAIQFLSLHIENSQTMKSREYISDAIHSISNAIEIDCGEFKEGKHLPKESEVKND